VFETHSFHSLWKFALHVLAVQVPYVPFGCKACVQVQFATVQACVFALHSFHTFVYQALQVFTVQAQYEFFVAFHVCVHVPFGAVQVFVFDVQVFHSLWKFALHVLAVQVQYVQFGCRACVQFPFTIAQACVFALHSLHTFVCQVAQL